MFASAMEFFSQHIVLANLTHVAGGFGLALVLQRYFPGKIFLSAKIGWFLLGFAVVVHIYAYKVPLFIVAGLLLTVSGAMRYIMRNAPCPIDPAQAKACMRMRRISAGIFYFSLAVYAAGFFFAFMAYRFV